MTTHHYPVGTLYSDYLRVAVGLVLTLGPLLLLDLATAIAWLLSVLAILFAWFGMRTVMRQLSAVELASEGIAIRGPMGSALPWNELAGMKLAYYAPRSWSSSRRRDRHHERHQQDESQRGWLQLTLQAKHGRPLRIESTLEGFDQVLRRALAAVAHQQLSLDPTTMANLAALGIDRDDPANLALKLAASGHDLAPNAGRRGSA